MVRQPLFTPEHQDRYESGRAMTNSAAVPAQKDRIRYIMTNTRDKPRAFVAFALGLAAVCATGLTEQAEKIRRGCLGKRAFILAAGGSQRGERVRNEARLVAAPPHRHRRQVRGVSLDQQTLERQCRRDKAKLLALFERQYAGKRDVEADSHRCLRKREAGGETVQHSSQGPCLMLGFEYRNHMLVGSSGVHDQRETTCPCGGNMRSKYSNLNVLRTSVVVEVEPAFADAHNFRMSS